jgi:hypothetical protein
MSSVSRTIFVLSCILACTASSLAPAAHAKSGWIEQIGWRPADRHQKGRGQSPDIVELLITPASQESWKQLEAFGLPYIEGIPPFAILFPPNAEAE